MFAVRRFNANLSALLRQKLARGGLEWPSVALGVYPPEAEAKPKVGGFTEVNLENLVAMGADLLVL